jgi:hypothetical protein
MTVPTFANLISPHPLWGGKSKDSFQSNNTDLCLSYVKMT